MSLGPFVEDVTLNNTPLPNDPNSIKVKNTILEASRLRGCRIELDSTIDDAAKTTVADLMTSVGGVVTSVSALQTNKADAATVNTLSGTVTDLSALVDSHVDDANVAGRHINTVAGTNDFYLAYDSTKATGTTNIWKQLPASSSVAPMVFELKTTAFTAASNHFYQVDVTAPISITLPADPVQGEPPIMFRISGASVTNVVTFLRNGSNIERIADDGYITGNGTIKAMFSGTMGGVNVGWVLADGQTY